MAELRVWIEQLKAGELVKRMFVAVFDVESEPDVICVFAGRSDITHR